MVNTIYIHWFRSDLRLSDNPALRIAARKGNVLPIYILDDDSAGEYKIGSAKRVWLHHSLTQLNQSLGGKLAFFKGNAKQIIAELISRYDIKGITWNRCYEPWAIARDADIKASCKQAGIEAYSDNGSLLWEPWEALKGDGTPYRVFTPFYRRGCLNAPAPRIPQLAPDITICSETIDSLDVGDLELLPALDWNHSLESAWEIGENAAQTQLQQFLETGLSAYKEGRDFPAKPLVSKLSPYLQTGEISPNQIWYAAKKVGEGENLEHFLRELGWREFSYSLLYHFPDLPRQNLQSKFNAFPWQKNPEFLEAWKKGMTGYPIVDAAMRQLWKTGYMHNRMRMVVGSFLVKNLLLHWHHGEAWFWDCLVDADLASNSASWQWIAGCGVDAAPYFRVFNPVIQGERFDSDGEYTKQFVPELAHLPKKHLFKPWDAPAKVLEEVGVILGETYPKPIVDVKISRAIALEAYATLKRPSM